MCWQVNAAYDGCLCFMILCKYFVLCLFFLTYFVWNLQELITYDQETLLADGIKCTHHFTRTFTPARTGPNSSSGTRRPKICFPQEAEETLGEACYYAKQAAGTGTQNFTSQILLANVQPLENKWPDLMARIRFSRDIRNCNILCLTETWLTSTIMDHAIQLPRFFVHHKDRAEGKSEGVKWAILWMGNCAVREMWSDSHIMLAQPGITSSEVSALLPSKGINFAYNCRCLHSTTSQHLYCTHSSVRWHLLFSVS